MSHKPDPAAEIDTACSVAAAHIKARIAEAHPGPHTLHLDVRSGHLTLGGCPAAWFTGEDPVDGAVRQMAAFVESLPPVVRDALKDHL